MRMDDKPTQGQPFSPPPSIALGVDQNAISALVGALSPVVERYKHSTSESPVFRIADLNLGDGGIAACVVDAFRGHTANKSAHIRVSGTELDAGALEKAREMLGGRNALGLLDMQDASSSPAAALRNKLECGGGADVVMYAHAAYPNKLPSFKLARMVDRLGDMAAPHGAIVTLHNHGPSDADAIRKQALGLPGFSTAGLNCNTQQRLEQSFNSAKLHSFSVTVPNTVELPANIHAVEAIFSGTESTLNEKDVADAKTIRQTLEAIAGGKDKLDSTIAAMDDGERDTAKHYFTSRIREAGGHNLPITLGGGQMVMAFRSQDVAKEAFAEVHKACQQMSPPAIALPISRDLMPDFDKNAAHSAWKDALQQQGVAHPPRVCQAELDKGRVA